MLRILALALTLAALAPAHAATAYEDLAAAIRAGDGERVGTLLAAGTSVEATDRPEQAAPLLIAVSRGHQVIAERLLAHRGTLHTPDAATQALLSALDADDPAALRRALANGASASGSDETGRPLLARAAREGHLQVAQALRAQGARVDRAALPSGLAMTPLHLAVAGERPALIRWLAAQGAPLDARDSEGAPPLAWAQGDQRKALAGLLLELGAQPLPPKT